jgi:hypothetical protein
MLPLEIDIDAMSYLRGRLVMLRDSLKTGDFQAISGGMPEFGAFDRSGMLHHHHELAHGLMLETLRAVIESIDVFYTNLVRADEAFTEEDRNRQAELTAYQRALDNLVHSSYLPGLEDARDRYRDSHEGEA